MVETTNDWIQLSDGTPFDYEKVLGGEPYEIPKDQLLKVTAKALSQICRYTGHCLKPYSVAQHAVLCSYIGHRNIAYACLHHDDAEIVLSDMNTILKGVLNRRSGDAWKQIERQMEAWFANAMDNEGWRFPGVKTVDLIALQLERRWFMGPSQQPWAHFDDPRSFAANIDPDVIGEGLKHHIFDYHGRRMGFDEAWSAPLAEEIYLNRHRELQVPF